MKLGACTALFALHCVSGCELPSRGVVLSDQNGWPLVHEQAFAGADGSEDFAFSDPGAWRRGESEGGGCLELIGPSAYEPPYRSPLSIALIEGLWLGDFALELELCSTSHEYAHRDLCLFFGFESPAELRYAHLAPAPDENAHSLFAVRGAPRERFTPVQARGVAWGEGIWHRVRLERAGANVRLWFDGELVFQGSDPDPREGRIGLGSFDDTGRFRALRVFAPRVATAPPSEPYAR